MYPYMYESIPNNGLCVGTMHECTCVGASKTSKGAGTTTIIDQKGLQWSTVLYIEPLQGVVMSHRTTI